MADKLIHVLSQNDFPIRAYADGEIAKSERDRLQSIEDSSEDRNGRRKAYYHIEIVVLVGKRRH